MGALPPPPNRSNPNKSRIDAIAIPIAVAAQAIGPSPMSKPRYPTKIGNPKNDDSPDTPPIARFTAPLAAVFSIPPQSSAGALSGRGRNVDAALASTAATG